MLRLLGVASARQVGFVVLNQGCEKTRRHQKLLTYNTNNRIYQYEMRLKSVYINEGCCFNDSLSYFGVVALMSGESVGNPDRSRSLSSFVSSSSVVSSCRLVRRLCEPDGLIGPGSWACSLDVSESPVEVTLTAVGRGGTTALTKM